MIRHGMIRHGMIRHGMIRHRMIRHGMIGHGTEGGRGPEDPEEANYRSYCRAEWHQGATERSV
jgi:hypothetical protein